MAIVDQINLDLVSALKAKNDTKVNVLRMLKSEMKYKQIDLGHELSDDEAIIVVSSAVKKRTEAIEEYNRAGRTDLADNEKAEYEVLKEYLPEQLTEDELHRLVDNAINDTGAISPKDIGLVMKALMPEIRGRADGKTVNVIVRDKLAGD
jgi:uncharacterized protein YqeY